KRRARGIIQLAKTQDAGAQQPPGIQNQPNGLAALDAVRPADQLAAARCCGPADVAQFIGLAIFAQALEFTAASETLLQVLFHGDLTAADQVDGVALRFLQIGIDANALFERSDGPAFGD